MLVKYPLNAELLNTARSCSHFLVLGVSGFQNCPNFVFDSDRIMRGIVDATRIHTQCVDPIKHLW